MIVHGYEFPGRFTPFAHQLDTWDKLVRHPRFFVFNDIGTGKTLSALWAADFLQSYNRIGRVLIVTTLSTVWNVWADELFKTLPHRSFNVVHHNSKAKRTQLLAEPKDYYIINHDGIKVLENEIMQRRDITHVIVDEGAEFSNKQTDKWRALNNICGPTVSGVKSYHRSLWWMTGGPTPNEPTDIWAQCRIVAFDKVPKYFSRFRDTVMYQQTKFKWLPRTGWENYIYSLLADVSVRHIRDKCIDLPDCVVEQRVCEMSTEQQSAYTQMKKELLIEMRQGLITAANEGIKRLKLLQIACGAIYDNDHIAQAFDVKPKLRMLVEAINEAGGKVIILTPFRHTTELLQKALSKRYSVGKVDGGVSVIRRREIFSSFQHGDLDLIVAHPRTMAHGLDLTTSHTIIWWSPIDGYRFFEQANGRITRPGQKHKQTIIQLICSDVERLVYKRLSTTGSMQGLLLELLGENNGRSN